MKKNVYLFIVAALAAVTSFTSCSKDEVVSPSYDNVLVIELPDALTRMVETPVAADSKSALADVTVFLLNNDNVAAPGTVNTNPYHFTPAEISAKKARIEQVSSTVNKVLVLANIPSTERTAVEALTTATAIKAYTFAPANQNVAGGVDNKILLGEATVIATPVNPEVGPTDSHIYKEASVTLTSLTARFEIGGVKEGTGWSAGSLQLIRVWVNNYYKDGLKAVGDIVYHPSTSNVWTVTAPAAASGLDTPAATDLWATIPGVAPTFAGTYPNAEYWNDVNLTDVNLTTGTKAYAYHVFAGEAGTHLIPHVILLVKGQLANGKYVLGYVTFTKYYDNVASALITQINPNKIYKLGILSTGITIDANSVTVVPEQEAYDLGIYVDVDEWNAYTVTPQV